MKVKTVSPLRKSEGIHLQKASRKSILSLIESSTWKKRLNPLPVGFCPYVVVLLSSSPNEHSLIWSIWPCLWRMERAWPSESGGLQLSPMPVMWPGTAYSSPASSWIQRELLGHWMRSGMSYGQCSLTHANVLSHENCPGLAPTLPPHHLLILLSLCFPNLRIPRFLRNCSENIWFKT